MNTLNIKNFFYPFICICVWGLCGCQSYDDKPIFPINPAAEQEIPLLLPDDVLKNKLIGTWRNEYKSFFITQEKFSDGSLHYKKPQIVIENEETYCFYEDGNLTVKTKMNFQGSSNILDSQRGKWRCNKGILEIEYSMSLAKNYSIDVKEKCFVIFFDASTLQLYPVEDSREERTHHLQASSPLFAKLKITKYYYDKDGNMYVFFIGKNQSDDHRVKMISITTKTLLKKI